MTLTPGTRLGAYDITAQIGEGGMGQVFRATDTKLKRQVAIKSLPPAVAADAERLARFQREAEVLASLNHPNIAAIYGLEESGGMTALVMELVEGDDLSQRIARGAIPLDEALPIAKQIAEALEAAHEQGIIHRDLKPANIKVRADGTVKVLDFGLAKAMEPGAGSSPSVSMSPTLSIHATQAGIILGSAAYMSPEQASGKPVDKRSDIWSFGVVLFEMLTGRRLFDGETISHTLADVLRSPIDVSQLPADTPRVIREVLRRCLNRDVKKRTRDIGEVRIQIEDVLSGASEGTVSPGPSAVATVPSRTSERILWVSALALVATAAVAGGLAWGRGRALAGPPPAETRLEIATPATSDPFSFAISPDGRRAVFAASTHRGVSQLWLRPLEAAAAQPLPGTEGASFPFWSPDSRSVGFFAGSALKRIDIGGGQPQTLATSPGNRGGTWSADGVILFQSSTAGPISRVPAAGGEVVAVTKLSAGQASHRFPQFLPGGRQFLFYASGSDEGAGIYLGSLDAPGAKRVTASDTAGAYAPLGSPGWLFFTRQGALVARRFDATRGELTGDPVTVADPVGVDLNVFIGAFSVSATGLVTYRGGTAPNQLTWFDRTGKPLGTLGAPDSTQFDPALSPDGRRVAVSRVAQGNTDIWLIDAARTSRLTFDPNIDRYPRWSPDGSRIVFSNNRKGVFDLYQKSSNGAGAEALLLESPQTKWAQSWSPDGRFLLYGASFEKTNFDQWVLPIAGDAKPFPFLNSPYQEGLGAFSPDGHWVAYLSNESGQNEIYVRPFPGPGGQSPVSTSGGASPRWRPDGKELYYISPDSKLMAVPIVVKGTALEAGLPLALFQLRVAAFGAVTGYLQQYDVAPDGRFLINSSTDEGGTAPITVIENWHPEAKK